MKKEDNGLTRFYLDGVHEEETGEEAWVEAEDAVTAAGMALALHPSLSQTQPFSRMEWFSKTSELLSMHLNAEGALQELQALTEKRNERV